MPTVSPTGGAKSLLGKGASCSTWTTGNRCTSTTGQHPPPEEVLAIKLCIEHREPWVRNVDTITRGEMRFANPFPGDTGARDQATLHDLRATAAPFLEKLGQLHR